MKRSILLTLLIALLVANAASGQSPGVLPFQAVVTGSQGAPLAPDSQVAFSIYNDEFDGSIVWGPEIHTVSPDPNGVISVELGRGDTPLPLPAGLFAFDSELWLAIGVGGEELSRIRIGHTARAFNSRHLDGHTADEFSPAVHEHALSGLSDVNTDAANEGYILRYVGGEWTASPLATSDGDWSFSGIHMYTPVVGNVGIGTNLPTRKLDVRGDVGVFAGGRLSIGTDDVDTDDTIYFNLGQQDYFRWDRLDERFEISDHLAIAFALQVGNLGVEPVDYNRLGTNFSTRGLNDFGDLLVTDDLEVDGSLIVEDGLEVIGPVVVPDESFGHQVLADGVGVAQGVRQVASVQVEQTYMVDVVTVSLTTPGPGYIVVEAVAQAAFTGTALENRMALQIDEAEGGTRDNSYYHFAGGVFADESTTFHLPISSRRTYYKALEGSYTFRLEAMKATTTGEMYLFNPVITATFVPRSYGAVSTLVSAAEAGGFDSAEPVLNSGADQNAGSPAGYVVDLRDLELRAERTRAEALRAEQDLQRARRATDDASRSDGSGD